MQSTGVDSQGDEASGVEKVHAFIAEGVVSFES